MKHPVIKTLSIATLAAAVAACGGSGGGSDSDEGGATGTMSLGLTDAAVDSVQEVNITVTGVVLQPADGERVSFAVDNPEQLENINLLSLQDGQVENLLAEQQLPAGDYNWMRLQLADESTFSVLDDNGGLNDLFVPSADQRGLQTSGFTIPAGDSASFTIDFDVRKSLVYPPGQDRYLLKPVLRLVDNAEVGGISGTIGQTLLATCADTNDFAGAVYIYEGSDVTPDDLGSTNEPLVVAPVKTDTGDYDYTAAFLSAGEYTVSYTCDLDERQDADGNLIDEELTFTPGINTTVVADEVTSLDIVAN